jgi:hypothetical protein
MFICTLIKSKLPLCKYRRIKILDFSQRSSTLAMSPLRMASITKALLLTPNKFAWFIADWGFGSAFLGVNSYIRSVKKRAERVRLFYYKYFIIYKQHLYLTNLSP